MAKHIIQNHSIMGQKPYILVLGLLLLLLFSSNILAQNLLSVEYTDGSTQPIGVPDFLNICGEPDTARVVIRSTSFESEARENIQAVLDLFKGAEFVEFIASESDAGISLLSSTVSGATFSIPDLEPNVLSEVMLVFTLKANCEFIDTINANNTTVVFDTWDFTYDFDGTTGMMESEMTAEYKDAFKVPNLTATTPDNVTISSFGECFSRDMLLSNSGLSGFIDTLEYSALIGPGITVTSVFINGIEYTDFVKTASGTDTMYTATIAGVFMQSNSLGAGMGDGDVFLDPDESITITENICVLSCDLDRESVHTISWGCYGSTCETEVINNFVSIGNGAPNPVAANTGTIPNVNTGYCQEGVQTVTFTNQGQENDPGYGTMRDVELGIGIGNALLLDEDKFEIFEVIIAGQTLTTTDAIVMLDGNLVFNTDIDGAGGLIDWDDDGYFDDLPINESIEVTVRYRFDCTEAVSTDESCENNASESLHSEIRYSNACGERITYENRSVLGVSNITPDSESSTDVDAAIALDVFHVTYYQKRIIRNFEKSCGGGEQLIVTVELPTGISVDLAETGLYRLTSSVPLLSSQLDGNIMTLTYDASPYTSIAADYTIDLAFTAGCDATPGATSFPITFSFYCPTCDCTHLWYCGDLSGPVLHASVPPCDISTMPPCPNGIRTLGFDVSRTTFGYTDETYTTKVDPATANAKVAITCDSVQMTISSVVGDDVISNNVGATIRYDNPEGEEGGADIFLFGGGTVEVRQTNGNVATCIVDPSVSTTTAAADSISKSVDFQLDDCLNSLGLVLSPGDTITFIGMFSMNPNGPYSELFKLVPNFRGEIYHDFGGTIISCDNYGEVFTVAKTASQFDYPSNTSYPKGCQETALSYSLSIFNNDFNDFFIGEFRQAAFVDSIKFEFDPAILDAFEDLTVEVKISNHPIFGDTYYALPSLSEFPDGQYVARFDTLTHIPSYNTSFLSVFDLKVNLIANCGSESASVNGDNSFMFFPTISYRDRIYAEEIGDGSCAIYQEETKNTSILYTEPPTFLIQALSPPNPEVLTNSVTYLIEHCNTSLDSDAGLNWIAIDIPNSAITITSIVDVSGTTPESLVFEPYGSGNSVFAYVEPLLRNFSGNSAADICNEYLITASVDRCGLFPFVVRSGWNCTAYDEADWTPDLYAPCLEDTINLSLESLEGALDAEVTTQPTELVDLCTVIDYEILIRNTDLGSIYDIKTEFFLPLVGLDFVPNSFELAYTSNAASVPIPDPTLEGITIRGENYVFDDFSNLNSFLDVNGLQGFNPLAPADSNEYVIKFQMIPSCGFNSGDLFEYSFQGFSGCGDSTNIEFGESFPIFINEVPAPTQFFLAEFGAGTSFDPIGTGTIEVEVTNSIGQATDDNDIIRVVLPPGVTYDPGTVVATAPLGWTPGEPVETIDDGFNIIYWPMPEGVPLAGEINFSFGILGDPVAECMTDTLEFSLFTMDMEVVNCPTLGVDCEIFAGTTEGGEQFLDLIVSNGVRFTTVEAVSTCTNDTNEELTVDVTIDGLPTLAQDGLVYFFYDVNMNGIGEFGTDVLLSQFTIPNGTISTISFTETFSVTNDQLCNLIISIDDAALTTCPPPSAYDLDPILQNSGADFNYCGTPTIIGTDECAAIGTYTYEWTAISPATTDELSATNIPQPTLTVDPAIPVGSTLSYVLTTTRAGCGYASQDVINVTIIDPLNLTITTDNGTTICSGTSTTLTANAVGATTFQWSDGVSTIGNAASITVSPTANTTYSVTATSGDGCSATGSQLVTITNNPTATADTDLATICSGSSAQLNGIGAGGTGSYTFSWTGANLDANNIASPIASPTITTTYTLLITDSNGCTATDDVLITVDNDVPTANATDAQICPGESTTLSASGGTTFAWVEMPGNPSVGTLSATNIMTPTFTATAAGTYNFEVTISGGCEDLTLPASVIVENITVTSPQVDLDECNGANQSVSITISEAVQSFTVNSGSFQSDNFAGNTITFQASFDTNDSNYIVEITGVSGCTVTSSFDFIECPCIPTTIINTAVTNSNCGESTGTATISITGNPTDYNFNYTPNVGTPSADGSMRSDLPAGVYQVEIEEIATPDCITSTTIVVGNSDGPVPTSIVTSPATCADNDGTATLFPTDWTYTWLFDNGTDNPRTDLASGIYGVEVTDPTDLTCTNFVSVVIQEDNDLLVSHTVINAPTCNNADGEVQLTVTGGSGTYDYVWNDGGTGDTRSDLASGTHLVNITETGGQECSISYIFALTDSDVPNAIIDISEVADVTCMGDSDGGIVYGITYPGTVAVPVDTIITDGFSEWENGSLSPGQYCMELIDANGCVIGADCFEIASPEAIVVTVSSNPSCSDGGMISLDVTGGTGSYTYDWADIAGTNNPRDRDNLTAGNYQLTITDSKGCSLVMNGGIDVASCPCTIEPFIQSVTVGEATCGLADGSATLVVLPTTAGLVYTWSPNTGIPNVDGNGRTELMAGGYTVIVSDASGECTDSISFVVTNEGGPELDAPVVTTAADCGAANGTATLSPATYAYDWSDTGSGAVRTGLPAGTYFVTITDTGNTDCTTSVVLVTIGQDNNLTVDINIDQLATCGNSDGIVTATPNNGTGPYSYAWDFSNITTATVANVPAGIHSVTVSDLSGNGCQTIQSFTMTNGDVTGVDIAISNIENVSCWGAADGMFDFTVTPLAGFQGPETVVISNGNSSTDLSGGEYCITVLDANGCIAGISCVTIEENAPLQATYSISDGCDNTGAIDVTVTGGTGTYNYEWSGSSVATEDRNNLVAGTYNVTVTDGNGCSLIGANLTVECPCIPTTLINTAVTNSNCGESTGTATISITGNPTDYNFNYTPNVGTPSSDGSMRSDLPAGVYQVEVEEIATPGCITTTTIVIGNSDGPVPTSIVTTPATCVDNDGTATFLPSDWTYTWLFDNGTDNPRTDLAAGIYGVEVSDPTDPTCTNFIRVVIQEDNDLMVSHMVTNDPTCNNSDGEVQLTVTGGSGTYDYVWNDGGTGDTRSDLASGTHLVNITETGGQECSISYIFALTDSDVPNAIIDISEVADVTCMGDSDGGIVYGITYPGTVAVPVDTIITDGFSEWENGSLSPGQYCMELIDANGCVIGADCFEIASPEAIVVTVSSNPSCSDGGMISLDVTGGTGSYTYDWADIAGTNNPRDRDNLTAGNYQLTITDSKGCSLVMNGGIDVASCPCTIEPFIQSVTVGEATCGLADGSATLVVLPTTAGLVYTWSPNTGIPNVDGNGRTELMAGGYTVIVSDASGECTDSISFVVTNEGGPELDAPVVTTAADCGAANGTATLSPATYAYDWSDTGSGAVRTGLPAGTYFVTITDTGNTDCTTSVVLVTIGQDNNLTVDINIDQLATCGNSDGIVTATPNNGTGPYSYAWDFSNITTATVANVPAGIHSVTVSDLSGNGCQTIQSFTMTNGDVTGVDIAISNIENVSCWGAADGMFDFTVTPLAGFQGPETVVISNGNSSTDLSGGEYCITVLDANGCIAGISCVTIEENAPLQATYSISGGCDNDGVIDVTVTGGTGTYTYEWSDGSITTEDREDLMADTYNVTITDGNSCSIIGADLLIECTDCLYEPQIESVTIFEATCGNSDGSAIINVNVDPAVLIYTWEPNVGTVGSTGNIRTELPSGAYSVTVSEPNGICFDVVQFALTNEDAPELDGEPVTTDADCASANGSAILLPAAYTYNWAPISGMGSTRNDLPAGTYFVTYFDPATPDCTGVIEVNIGQTNNLDININIDTAPTCGNSDGTVTANVANGSGTYSYDWSTGGNSMTETGISAGVHTVNVVDLAGDGCEASETFILIDSDVSGVADVAINDIVNITCFGAMDGGVDFDVDLSPTFQGPGQIIITNGTQSFTNGTLGAGQYCIEVRDANGCVAGGDCFEITEPEKLEVGFSISGACADNGAIDVIVTGGTGNYTFDWIDLAGISNMEDRDNLPEGLYSVVVSDENGCSVVGYDLPIECTNCQGPTIDYTLVFESACGLSTGSAEVILTENPAGFVYEWTPSGVGTVSADGNMLSDIPAGVYLVDVMDPINTACSDSVYILVTNQDGPDAEIDNISAADCGGMNGSATLLPTDHIYTWPDGMTGDDRNDLAAGVYEVIFTTVDDTLCYNAIMVEIPEVPSFTLAANITMLPDPNMANGAANIVATGGSGTFTYFWSDGGMGDARSDLSAGTYVIVVTDEVTGCENEITITILNNVPGTATITIDDIINITCNGAGDGLVVYNVAYDAGFVQPATVVVTDGVNLFADTNLEAGNYCINVTDGNGVLQASECFVINEPEELELDIIATYVGCPDSGELGMLDAVTNGGTAPYTFDWDVLPGTSDPQTLMDLTVGTYSLTVTDDNGCSKIADNIFLPELCPECEYFDGMDSLIFETSNCGDTINVCAGISAEEFFTTDYDIYIDGMLSNPDVIGCNITSSVSYMYSILFGDGNNGPYFLDSWELDGQIYSGEFPNFTALVDSMNIWDANGLWVQNPFELINQSTGDPFGYGEMRIYQLGIVPPLVQGLSANPNSAANGVAIPISGEGEHELVIINNENSCADTLIVSFVCNTFEYGLTDTILLGTVVDPYCFDVMAVLDNTTLEGNTIASIENICPDSSGTSVIFTIDNPAVPCISYTGITPGTDMACILVCDELNNCDTFNFVVHVYPSGPEVIYDTLVIAADTSVICLDTLTDLGGEITGVINYCDDLTDLIEYSVDTSTWCVTYWGVDVGLDSLCLAVTDEFGNIDTVIVHALVVNTTPEIFCDTIFIGPGATHCLDTTELVGNLLYAENICEDESTGVVEFFVDQTTWCVTYQSVLELGTDTACIVLYDDLGFSDTTYYCITVIENFDLPIAIDDYDSTFIDVPVVVNVKANDTIFGVIDTLYVLTDPIYGTTNTNLDCTITYSPDPGVCSVTDEFQYVVCNPNGCDTATVYVYIACEELTIFNALSPNGDDLNEVFYIDGIEDYPNNYLCVFNRWGNRVYEKEGYNNEWHGDWEGNFLPDGTYFYILKLDKDSDDKNGIYQGYLQINR